MKKKENTNERKKNEIDFFYKLEYKKSDMYVRARFQ